MDKTMRSNHNKKKHLIYLGDGFFKIPLFRARGIKFMKILLQEGKKKKMEQLLLAEVC